MLDGDMKTPYQSTFTIRARLNFSSPEFNSAKFGKVLENRLAANFKMYEGLGLG